MGDYGSVYRHVFPDTLSRRQINQKTASASCLQIKQEASVISAMRERSLFHDIICNGNSASEHRLLFDYPVSTTKEKRFCRNGRVRCNPPSADGTLQRIANQRSNALVFDSPYGHKACPNNPFCPCLRNRRSYRPQWQQWFGVPGKNGPMPAGPAHASNCSLV